MRTVLLLLFLALSHTGFAQLIDPFEKIKTHEIKLTKLDDGAYMGAMEWTTGGIDSLQRFVVQNLDVKAPVMVRIISKAPDHNIDLSFHKKKWNKIESKVSTDGDKFVDKIFRTMGTAGIGVSSKVAGIPYLLVVRVGLQFPSTKSLIRITDDIEEYNSHLRKMGISTIAIDKNVASSNNDGNSVNTSNDGSNTLMYVIIGLLSSIIVLLGLFLVRKQKSKTTLVFWFAMGLSAYSMAQSKVPKPVPVDGQGESPVFFNYRTSNVANQNPVPITTVMNSQDADVISFNTDGSSSTRSVRINTNPGARELSGKDAAEVLRRIKEANEEFDTNYRANIPGEPTEGDQRVLPSERNRRELQQLRGQVRQLQQQVELLSQEDNQYEEQDDYGDEILLYCEDLQSCQRCVREGFTNFTKRRAYFDFLQKFYLKKSSDLNDWVEWGNSISSIPGGGGMAWGPIYMHKVKPAIDNLKKAYSNKFDEYIELMEADLELVNSCLKTENGNIQSKQGYETQMFVVVKALKASKINK